MTKFGLPERSWETGTEKSLDGHSSARDSSTLGASIAEHEETFGLGFAFRIVMLVRNLLVIINSMEIRVRALCRLGVADPADVGLHTRPYPLSTLPDVESVHTSPWRTNLRARSRCR